MPSRIEKAFVLWRLNMAKKMTTVFFCQECGYETSKWMGQCPGCKQWNTLVEEKVSETKAQQHLPGEGFKFGIILFIVTVSVSHIFRHADPPSINRR